MLTELDQVWFSNNWTDDGRYTYTYDTNGNSLTSVYETWQNNTWQPGLGFLEVFAQQNDVYFINQGYRYEASYSPFVVSGMTVIPTEQSFIEVYPNPASDRITVSINERSKENNTVLIYNMQGQLLLQETLKLCTTEIDITNFSNGIYLLRIINGRKELSSRFMKK
jgi:hypothetical protein